MALMAKKKSNDRHKVKAMVLRLSPRLRAQLEKMASANESKVTEEVRIAIRERLERGNFWPPPS